MSVWTVLGWVGSFAKQFFVGKADVAQTIEDRIDSLIAEAAKANLTADQLKKLGTGYAKLGRLFYANNPAALVHVTALSLIDIFQAGGQLPAGVTLESLMAAAKPESRGIQSGYEVKY